MKKLYVAADSAFFGSSVNLFGHLQIVYDDGSDALKETEVQANFDFSSDDDPTTSPTGGVWQIAYNQDHFTPEWYANGEPRPSGEDKYGIYELELAEGQDAESVWALLGQVASHLEDNHNDELTYDTAGFESQNSNSYVRTLLDVIGNTTNWENAFFSNGMTDFPGYNRNVFTDLAPSIDDGLPLAVAGTPGNDIINGGGDKDNIGGQAGDDTLRGGENEDTLTGGSGKDLFLGTPDELDGDEIKDLEIGDRIGVLGETVVAESLEDDEGGNPTVTFNTEGGIFGIGADEVEITGKIPDGAGLFLSDQILEGGGSIIEVVDIDVPDGPLQNSAGTILDATGSTLGVIGLEAPTFMGDGDAEYTVSLAGVGRGVQYNVAYIIDISGSMGGQKISDAQNAYTELTNQLKDLGVAAVANFAVIPFNSGSILTADLTADEAIAEISSLSAGGGTNFGPALSNAQTFFSSANPGQTNVAYFLSDGQGSGASDVLTNIANVQAFGIGSGADLNSLNTIDSDNAVALSSSAQLVDVLTGSSVDDSDIDRIEISLDGTLVETVTPDQLVNGPLGLQFTGTVTNLDVSAGSENDLEAIVYLTNGDVSGEAGLTIAASLNSTSTTTFNGTTNVTFGAFSNSFDADANGVGAVNLLANELDNNVTAPNTGGTFNLFGGNDFFLSSQTAGSTIDRVIDGGDGYDVVEYLEAYNPDLIRRDGSIVRVGENSDSLTNVEEVRFSDASVSTDDLSVNFKPNQVALAPSTVDENAAAETVVGAVTVTDPDAGDTHTLTLVDDAGGRFALDGSDIVVAAGAMLDFEANASHTVTVRATDAGGLSVEQDVEIVINNLLEIFQGSEGDNDFRTGVGGDSILLAGGSDVVRGALENFFDDVIDGFGVDDLLVFEALQVPRTDIDVTLGSAVLAVDGDGDGNADGSFTLEGDFSGGDFMAVGDSGNTLVTFETFLPVLQERQAVDPDLVNGIINQNFLKGDGTTDFQVTLRDLGFAGYDNVLGVYEIDAAGNIVDTRILFDNANADKSASTLIEDVEDGHNLGFFIVQDAADWAATLAAGDTLSFVNGSGGAANVSDGADISIAVNGATVDEMVFHSFDEDMNSDDLQHALSGVEVGGEAITIGFEDLTGGGDRDYEDVAFRVELVDDFAII